MEKLEEELTIEDLVGEKKVTVIDIAKVINYGKVHISNILNGRAEIGEKINNIALKMSKGKISFHDVCAAYIKRDIENKINHLNRLSEKSKYSLNKID